MSFKNLDTCIVVLILQYLSEFDVLHFSTVFPEHHEAVQIYWNKVRSMCLDKLAIKDINDVTTVLSLCLNVKEFTFKEPKIGISFHELPEILSLYGSKIEKIFIIGFVLSEEYLKTLNDTMRSLKSLTIYYDGTDEELGILFQNNPGIIDCAVCDIGRRLTGSCLEELPQPLSRISFCNFIFDVDILLRCVDMERLKHLEIEGYVLTRENLEIIAECTSLQSLVIICATEDPLINQILTNNPDLNLFQLYVVSNDSNQTIDYLPQKVQNIYLCGNAYLNSLDHLNYPNLEKFVQHHRREETNSQFLSQLARAAPNLKHIFLPVLDATPFHLIAEFKRLKSLHLRAHIAEIDNVFETLAHSCQTLKHLCLFDIQSISLTSFNWIAKMQNLKKLEMKNCNCPNFDSIIILEHSTSLMCINIDRCPYFTDAMACYLIRHCKYLQRMGISFCCTTPDLVRLINMSVVSRHCDLKLFLEKHKIPTEFLQNLSIHHPQVKLYSFRAPYLWP